MTKPHSAEEFAALVTTDFTWRLREVSNLKLAIANAKLEEKNGFLRALVVMCYAHWEGHAKFCGERYFQFLTKRRLRFSQLKPHFYNIRFLRELSAANGTSHEQKMNLAHKICSSLEDRFSHFPKELFDTKSNLNSEVLADLCLVCGIEFEIFEDYIDFMDRMLLKRRNEVAHGEAVFIDAVDADDLVDRTTSLMRTFRDEIDNHVTLQGYRAAPE
ncbi:MAE_28990/MAE_18760 family HEPN-like nuclease [Parasphingorhabdus sp.]|uniref:MAE_28990/MAE_18760 family HEPN-like nuclease n=1 Tax=Parasphingorhabdus sp. TaxID=2709688 RepID=UPI0030024F3F